ncbi:hypothetical protein T492DRAFT_336520 [Pavlovales sp. CCMP2436]|nr:hypothetical protein T492DRAFT_336520 [Pavlovales sp. CCMP2436]
MCLPFLLLFFKILFLVVFPFLLLFSLLFFWLVGPFCFFLYCFFSGWFALFASFFHCFFSGQFAFLCLFFILFFLVGLPFLLLLFITFFLVGLPFLLHFLFYFLSGWFACSFCFVWSAYNVPRLMARRFLYQCVAIIFSLTCAYSISVCMTGHPNHGHTSVCSSNCNKSIHF